jgi:Na+/glutamate symporter
MEAKFCIPDPVVGGLLFAIATCILYALVIMEFTFDETLKNVCKVLQDLGMDSAATLATAAAIFGLVAGSLLGGRLGRRPIIRHDLLKTAVKVDDSVLMEDEEKHIRKVSVYQPSVYQLVLAMGIGTIVSFLLMALFAYFVVYNLMGRDYDAAVLTAGTCGFGMGATPNAMANMQAITQRYLPSVKAFLLVPLVGSLFADLIR